MVWNYPDISLEEMVKRIKGFVDILILASGYQSSGLLAHWDSHQIKKAFQWVSFFENVLRQLSSSDVYHDSVNELDAAIHEMTNNPSFPQGLASLSYDSLKRARNLVLEHLIHTLPLRDSHLRALLTAVIEMELEKLSGLVNDSSSVYINKLIIQNAPFNLVSERSTSIQDSVIVSNHGAPATETGNRTDDDLTKFTLQELLKKQSAVSGVLATGTGLDILSNAIGCSDCQDFQTSISREQPEHEKALLSVGSVDQLANFITWNHWKLSNLSYFLHKRTVRLVSGASMIFSAPKFNWMQVLERLSTSASCNEENDLLEIMEILLVGCVASKWNSVIEYFMSVSYDSFTITKLYLEVRNLFSGTSLSFHSKGSTNSKESGILEYLAELLDGQFHQLWRLSPALVAIAISFWSSLFRLYLSEIETQFKGDSSAMRCCSCVQDRKEHEDLGSKGLTRDHVAVSLCPGQVQEALKCLTYLSQNCLSLNDAATLLIQRDRREVQLLNVEIHRWCQLMVEMECQLAERIWCLYIFHVLGAPLINGTSNA